MIKTSHPREHLPVARAVVAAPEQHERAVVLRACELMISFGNAADLLEARATRAAIERGVIMPGRDLKIRRLIGLLSVLCAVTWLVAIGLERLVDAQKTGALPSVQEIIR